jgi:signal transduction histidine kinase
MAASARAPRLPRVPRLPRLVGLTLAVAVGAALGLTGIWLGLTSGGIIGPTDLEPGPSVGFFLVMASFVAAGALLALKRRGNAVGWVLLSIGIAWLSYGVGGWARLAALAAPIEPARAWAAWAWDVLWIPGVALVPLLFLLFPDGRLPTPRWRAVPALLAFASAALFVAIGLRPGALTNTPLDNPLGVSTLAGFVPLLEAGANLGFVVAVFASLAAPVLRYRRADAEERDRLKWFVVATSVVVSAWAIAAAFAALGAPPVVLEAVRIVPLVSLPLAVALAVLHHRLLDFDLVLSRSLAYTALVTCVGLLYVGVVALVGTSIGERDGAGVPLAVAATILAAVAFQPIRTRLQRLADRVVFGPRESPYDLLRSFIGRTTRAYAAGEAPAAIAEGVGAALRLSRCDVWLRLDDGLRLVASWPGPVVAHVLPLPPEGAATPLPGSAHVYLVHHDARLLGAIGVTPAVGGRLSAGEDRLLADLAGTAGLALDNARLVRDLRTSQQRLVAASDAQRRDLERDLHDGAQQRLLELALTLRMAHRQATSESFPAAAETIASAETLLRTALAELRDLARGIHPAILTERGLVPAVESLAERAPLAVRVSADGVARMRPTVEATAYFVCAEAVANVIKHARASSVAIVIGVEADRLRVEVRDDGLGGADATAPGLSGLADRVHALDGRLEIRSPQGGGTRVVMELPCA